MIAAGACPPVTPFAKFVANGRLGRQTCTSAVVVVMAVAAPWPDASNPANVLREFCGSLRLNRTDEPMRDLNKTGERCSGVAGVERDDMSGGRTLIGNPAISLAMPGGAARAAKTCQSDSRVKQPEFK